MDDMVTGRVTIPMIVGLSSFVNVGYNIIGKLAIVGGTNEFANFR